MGVIFGMLAFFLIGAGMETAGVEGNHFYMMAGYVIGALSICID